MPSASDLTHKAAIALDFLERMANDCILHPGGVRELRAEDLDFRLDSWRRLRTNRLRGDIDSKEVSQLFRDANLLNHMVHALEGVQTSASLLQQNIQLRLEPIISKLSNGIASLSDELIMLIFEFTVPVGEQILRKPYQPPQASQPILLSHVSRRFRNAALKTPQLWTTLDGHACRTEQEAFIARSGEESNLHIIIHASMYGSTASGFLDICLPLARRWKTLLVTSDGAWDTPNVVDALLRDIFGSRTGGAGERFFPRLQELYVKDTGRNSTFLETSPENRFEPEAEIPSLLHLRCHGYTPARSPAYSSVKSFRSMIPMPATTPRFDLPSRLSALQKKTKLSSRSMSISHIALTELSFIRFPRSNRVRKTSGRVTRAASSH
ncbi:hypothetical protein SCHPADRAFT_692754 [Schizopora paradoxa]|uniref:F-box domain-containing protein n=1 Tax=Schizopora paradoxa TaxID=27342 RepID=A0A0H2RNE0_9AGAM|nr:hypothetical protein SCHPADRAFT_692754 [Schizopora paradoxa]